MMSFGGARAERVSRTGATSSRRGGAIENTLDAGRWHFNMKL
jgi:hypothetical protein